MSNRADIKYIGVIWLIETLSSTYQVELEQNLSETICYYLYYFTLKSHLGYSVANIDSILNRYEHGYLNTDLHIFRRALSRQRTPQPTADDKFNYSYNQRSEVKGYDLAYCVQGENNYYRTWQTQVNCYTFLKHGLD